MKEAAKYVKMLEELEKDSGLGPNTYASVDLSAQILEAQGERDEALFILERHVARKGALPEEVLLIFSCLTRQKRFKEAFERCESSWEGKCNPEVLGAVSVRLVRMWKDVTDAQVRGVEKRLKAALGQKKYEKSVVLRMHLADLYDKLGQYDLSAEQYRAVLKEQPSNVVALNNLAWMLAMRAGDAHKALDHIDRAIAGMGRRGDLLDTRALVHLAMREPGKAIADLNEAIQDAATPTRLFHLARAYHENRDQSKAKETLQKAKDRGLDIAILHPVEHEDAKKLLNEYRLN
jgi:tetratricopeptide (TPR) repeat protein